jgi:hypothetical protein
LKEDIFNNLDKKPIREIFKDFKAVSLDEINTRKVICHTNATAQQCNSLLLTKWNEGEIKVGDYLLCRKELKKKEVRLFTNYEYIVQSYAPLPKGEATFTLLEPFENLTFEIDGKIFQDHLRLSYSNTVHSIQGLTIREPLTIADLGSNMVKLDPRFLWVAITRNENLDNIYVCFNHTTLKIKNLKEKIQGHITEDLNKGFTWEMGDYVNEKWFNEQLFKQRYVCRNCCVALHLDYEGKEDFQYNYEM